MRRVALSTLLALAAANYATALPQQGSQIIHDAEFYVLESQNGEHTAFGHVFRHCAGPFAREAERVGKVDTLRNRQRADLADAVACTSRRCKS